jgi:hypothetical protein
MDFARIRLLFPLDHAARWGNLTSCVAHEMHRLPTSDFAVFVIKSTTFDRKAGGHAGGPACMGLARDGTPTWVDSNTKPHTALFSART